jgi:hypothetical protein
MKTQARSAGYIPVSSAHRQGIIHLDTQLADRTLQLGVAKQQLNRAQVLGAPANQRCFRAPNGMSPVGARIQADMPYPGINDA